MNYNIIPEIVCDFDDVSGVIYFFTFFLSLHFRVVRQSNSLTVLERPINFMQHSYTFLVHQHILHSFFSHSDIVFFFFALHSFILRTELHNFKRFDKSWFRKWEKKNIYALDEYEVETNENFFKGLKNRTSTRECFFSLCIMLGTKMLENLFLGNENIK